jgi:hypothetical protein
MLNILGVGGNPVTITADISRDTFDVEKNYDKLLFQQGRPLLDAELNELQDIDRAKFVDVVQSAIGNGPSGEGLRVVENVDLADANATINKVRIHRGVFYHEGTIIRLHDDFVLSGLTTPVANRDDIIYALTCFLEVDSTDDPNIKDLSIGVETARRIQISVQFFIAEGSSSIPNPPAGCKAFPLALIHRHANCQYITEVCPCCDTVAPYPNCGPCSPCHTEGDIVDLRVSGNQSYCDYGVEIRKSSAGATLAFTWSAGSVIVANQIVAVTAGSATAAANMVTYVYVASNGSVLQQTGSAPAGSVVVKAKLITSGTDITSITDLCVYRPSTGIHDHNDPGVHLNLQGGVLADNEMYHMSEQQWVDIVNGDGGATNYADAHHKHSLAGLDLFALDDRYVNETGDTMTGDLVMAGVASAAVLVGAAQEPFDITVGVNDQLIVTVNGGAQETVTLGDGTDLSAQAISDDLTVLFANHSPQIAAFATNVAGHVVISTDLLGAGATISVVGSAATVLGFTSPNNNSAIGSDPPAIRSNFVTYPNDGGSETPRAGAFFVETDLPSPLETDDRPGHDIVGAGALGGPGRLVRIFDDLNVYGDLRIGGTIIGGDISQDHNLLLNLQGGVAGSSGERFHMSQSEWNLLISADGSVDIADVLHTHLNFDRITFTRPTAGSQTIPEMAGLNNVPIPFCFVGNVIPQALVIDGLGTSTALSRNVAVRDNLQVTNDACVGGLLSGHYAPIAGFTYLVNASLTYDFDAKDLTPPAGQAGDKTYTFDGDSPIEKYEWNWAYDGITFVVDTDSGGSATAAHTFGSPNTYLVALRVTNRHGHQDVRALSCNITIGGGGCQAAPTANFTAVQNPSGSKTVDFDGTSSTAGSGCSITNYEWDLNYSVPFTANRVPAGGAPISATGDSTPTYTFPTYGNFNVALRVANNAAPTPLTDIENKVVSVVAAPGAPTASYNIYPTLDAGDINQLSYLASETYGLASTATAGGGGPITLYEYDLAYDMITFTIDRSATTPAAITATFPSATLAGPDSITRIIAHRVKDQAGTYSSIVTKTTTVYNAPKFDIIPTYIGGTTTGGFFSAPCGGAARHRRLQWDCDNDPNITLRNNIPSGFVTSWSGGPTATFGGQYKYNYDVEAQLACTLRGPEVNSINNPLVSAMSPYYVDVTATITKGSRTRAVTKRVPLTLFKDGPEGGNVPNNHVFDRRGSNTLSLQIAGVNLNLNAGTFKVTAQSACGGTALSVSNVTKTATLITATISGLQSIAHSKANKGQLNEPSDVLYVILDIVLEAAGGLSCYKSTYLAYDAAVMIVNYSSGAFCAISC